MAGKVHQDIYFVLLNHGNYGFIILPKDVSVAIEFSFELFGNRIRSMNVGVTIYLDDFFIVCTQK